jgi:hypothetical protein
MGTQNHLKQSDIGKSLEPKLCIRQYRVINLGIENENPI